MRLLFVDSSHSGWGTELHLVELIKAVRTEGHSVCVVARRGSTVMKLLQSADVELITTPFRGGADPRGIAAIVRAIRCFKPEWMIASRCKLYIPIVTLGLLYGVRVALFRHLTYLKHWYQRQLITRLADRFYVVSQFAQDALAREGACMDRLTPLYNPIDIERFQPIGPAARSELRAELGFTDDDVIAGYVGRIEAPKGAAVLMDASCALMARVPELQVLWVGDGSAVPELRTRAIESGFKDRHRFVGWQCRVEKYMAALDYLVVPSLEAEAFGRVMAEAQACGVPVITSGTGGLPEAYIPGVTGLLAPAGDVCALSEAMELLARNVPLRARLATAGRDFVRGRFTSPQVANAFTRHLSARSLTAFEPTSLLVPQLRTDEQQVKLTV